MVGRTCIFKLKLNQYNTVQHREGFTVTDIEEVEMTRPTAISKIDSVEDKPEHNLAHQTKEPSKRHLQNKRKTPDDHKNSDQLLPDPENTSKSFSEVEQYHDAPRDTMNGDQIPPANSGTKGKSENKSRRSKT